MKEKMQARQKLLTETELELMNILWRLKEGTVHDVLEALPEERPLAYTTVSTMLRILEQKGILRARKVGRGHVYKPQLHKQEYETQSVTHLVDKVFDGTPLALVHRLLDTNRLSREELLDLQKMLGKRLD